LGVVLAPHRRRELTAWAAAQADRLILEDDYDAELRYDRRPVGALQSMAPDRVILMGSVSKTLSPALRLGWIIAPDHLTNELVAVKRHNDLGTSTLEQLPLQAFLADGAYQRHVRRTSQEHQRRRIAILKALSEAFPGVPITGVQAGLHLVLLLPDAATQTGIVNALRAQGVATRPLSASYQSVPRFGAVIGTARTTPQQILLASQDESVFACGLLHRSDHTPEGAACGAQFGDQVDRPRDWFIGAQHE
jgi:GntR family transcriptional regulator/MocR family aminotransferase